MKMATKHEILQDHLKEWLACKGDKKIRGAFNTLMAKMVKMHKNSISRTMKWLQLKAKEIKKGKKGQKVTNGKKRGRSILYGADVQAALYDIWDTMMRPCGEIMHSAIKTYVKAFIQDKSWKHDDSATGKLCAMSMGTLKNRIKKLREKHETKKGRSATVSSPLKGMIPIRKSHTWQLLPPGYVQMDTVVHCGDMLTIDVIYSLGIVDFRTYWIEYNAQWNKGQEATAESFEVIEKRVPFPLKEAHPDTGNEFINYHFHALATKKGIELTRSEPYKKNDNMCIEERNGNIPRKYLGYVRLDDKNMVKPASEILRVACLIHNHFIPVRRMIDKVRIGARWKRTFEKVAKTPYERVIEHPDVSEEDKIKLRAAHEVLNPIALKRELDMHTETLSCMVRKRNQKI